MAPSHPHDAGPQGAKDEAAESDDEMSFVLFDGPPDGLFGGFNVPANTEGMEENGAVASIMRLNPGCDEATARMIWRELR